MQFPCCTDKSFERDLSSWIRNFPLCFGPHTPRPPLTTKPIPAEGSVAKVGKRPTWRQLSVAVQQKHQRQPPLPSDEVPLESVESLIKPGCRAHSVPVNTILALFIKEVSHNDEKAESFSFMSELEEIFLRAFHNYFSFTSYSDTASNTSTDSLTFNGHPLVHFLKYTVAEATLYSHWEADADRGYGLSDGLIGSSPRPFNFMLGEVMGADSLALFLSYALYTNSRTSWEVDEHLASCMRWGPQSGLKACPDNDYRNLPERRLVSTSAIRLTRCYCEGLRHFLMLQSDGYYPTLPLDGFVLTNQSLLHEVRVKWYAETVVPYYLRARGLALAEASDLAALSGGDNVNSQRAECPQPSVPTSEEARKKALREGDVTCDDIPIGVFLAAITSTPKPYVFEIRNEVRATAVKVLTRNAKASLVPVKGVTTKRAVPKAKGKKTAKKATTKSQKKVIIDKKPVGKKRRRVVRRRPRDSSSSDSSSDSESDSNTQSTQNSLIASIIKDKGRR